MAGLIPKPFIDELIARVDIAEVISGYVKLTKAGHDFKACCPFHHEKTPSFTVSARKQFYHCFGCGAHGTVVGFLMDYAGLDFPDAIEHLAERQGIDVPREGGGPSEDWTALREALTQANAWFRAQLRTHASKKEAVDYLKRRGLTGQVAATFELGLAPPGRENLLRALGEKSIERPLMLQAGLVAERAPGQYHDRFRNRVMFPIHDKRGQVVGFGARVLDDGQPKYLNSPETPLFHKGRELYGLFQARKAHRKLDRLLVVEGYMDVVALAQFGITYAVATLGTAATSDHIERLFQNTSRVVFCFDGDRAGRAAAWRALENALPHMRDGRGIGFVFLPDGEDPDTLVRAQGPDALEALIRDARPLSDVLFEHLSVDLDLRSMEDRSKLYQEAKPLLEQLPPGAFRELAQGRLAQLTELSTNQIVGLISASAPQRQTGAPSANRTKGDGSRAPSLVRAAIVLLLHHPGLAQTLPDLIDLNSVDLPGVNLFRAMLDLLHKSPDLSASRVIEHFRDDPEGQHLGKLLADGGPLLSDGAGLEAEFRDAVERIVLSAHHRRRRALERKSAGPDGLSQKEKTEYAALVANERAR
jgi:DNA primase